MAKGKNKKNGASSAKNGRVPKGGSQYSSSDDESVETCSVFSGDSHCRTNNNSNEPENTNNGNNNAEEDDPSEEAVDNFEERLKEAMEGTSAKAATKRTASLELLNKALTSKYCPEFLATRPTTLIDIIERSLKKGRGDEQVQAALLAGVICLQFGTGDESNQLLNTLEKLLLTILHNNALTCPVRERAAFTLALCHFVADSDDPMNTQTRMASLEQVFSGSYLKGDGVSPSVTPTVSQLHQTCLMSWTLLLSICPLDIASNLINRYLPSIIGLLDSSDLEMRLSAGEAIATMFEIARSRDAEYYYRNEDSLCETLNELATDAQKFRAKKDRKLQRATFRDVLKAVREGESPALTIHFSRDESPLQLLSWTEKRHYEMLTYVLSSGTNHHLENNLLLRDIFQLGPPITPSGQQALRRNRTTKVQRHLINMAVDRQRTQRLSKLRDKRMDIF